MGLLSAIGAAAGALTNSPVAGSIVSGLFGLKQQDKANQAVNDTNNTNMQIAQQNLAFQRENLDYQKSLQQKIFDREDSAYQRTVNDMRQAGISPLAMNGTNGAGEAIATSPLQNDYKDSSYMKQFPNHVANALQTYSQLATLKQNQDFNQAQIDNVNADTAAKNLENKFQSLDFARRLAKSVLEKQGMEYANKNHLLQNEQLRLTNIFQQYLNADAKRQSEYNTYFQLNPQMTPYERAASFALKYSGLDYKSSPKEIKDAFQKLLTEFGDTAVAQTKAGVKQSFDFATNLFHDYVSNTTPFKFFKEKIDAANEWASKHWRK